VGRVNEVLKPAGSLKAGDFVMTSGFWRGAPIHVCQKLASVQRSALERVEVWDLENQDECYGGEGNFVANGFVVHNCVFTSVMHAARYQNERRLVDFQKLMRKELGGGWPAKLDKMVAKYAPGTPYVQYEGGDLAVLRAALATGRMPSVTYS